MASSSTMMASSTGFERSIRKRFRVIIFREQKGAGTGNAQNSGHEGGREYLDPDILLLDEMLAVGDAKFAEKSRARMEEFKDEGKTILLVTHDLKSVRTWCHDALWLHDGAVRAFGPSPAIVEQYLRFVGAAAEVK